MKQKIRKLWERLKTKEVRRYIIIGVCTTLVNFVCFTVLDKLLGVDENVSNAVSIMAAIVFAYFTNKIIVFESHCDTLFDAFIEFLKFVLSRLSTMLIEFFGMMLLHSVFGIEEIISKVITQGIVIIGNYFISKFIVFVEKKK